MTLRELTDAVLEEMGYAQSGASSDVILRIHRRLNDWQRRLLTRPGLSRFLKDTFSTTFASVASQAVYGLPAVVGRINAIREATNDLRLELRDMNWIRAEDPGLSSSGTPEAYAVRGWFPVKLQPSDASTLYVVSSDVGDTTQTVLMDYIDSSGEWQNTSAALSGTTDVPIGTNVVEVTRLFVSPFPAGTITVYEDSTAGTVLATIPAGQSSQQFIHVQLWPTPTAAITYLVDAVRESMDLVDENDSSVLPKDFHYLLVLGAVADEFRRRDDTRYAAVRQDMEAGLRDLNGWLWNTQDYSPGGTRGGHSRLGPWFPAGS